MKTMNLHIFIALGLAAGIAGSVAAGPVPGQEITLEFRNSSPSRAVKINYLFGMSATSINRPGGSFGYAGFLNWTNGYKTFCVQVKEEIIPDAITYTFAQLENTPDGPTEPGGMGVMRATMLRDLYSRWWNDVDNAGNEGRDLCAAFQAMIWEITHETLTDTGSMDPGEAQVDALHLELGSMQLNMMTDTAAAYFDAMKESLGGDKDDVWLDYLGEGLWGLTNPIYQDQIIVVPGAAAGFLGLGIFGARRRRRR